MKRITIEVGASAPWRIALAAMAPPLGCRNGWRGCRRLARSVLLASLALALSGCAARYNMGAGTSLAVDAMVVVAEQRRAAGDFSVPVGAYVAPAEGRLATGSGDDALEED